MTLETELQKLFNICTEDMETAKQNRDHSRADEDPENAAYYEGVKCYCDFILSIVTGDFIKTTGRDPSWRKLTAEEQNPG